MSHGRKRKSKNHQKGQTQRPVVSDNSQTANVKPEHKINWFELTVPLLIGFGLTVLVANNDAQTVVIAAWAGIFLSAAWLAHKLWTHVSFASWKKSIAALVAASLLSWFAYSSIQERLRPSYVFLNPGPWLLDGRWDLVVNHRGSKTSYGVQILFVDEDRLDSLKRSQKVLSPADLDSYQAILTIPEVNPKGRGTVFAKQFIWRPFSPEKSHFTVEITWRDGRAHEDLRIARVQEKWAYAMSLSNPETGRHLFDCKDPNYPSQDALPACFPGIVSTD